MTAHSRPLSWLETSRRLGISGLTRLFMAVVVDPLTTMLRRSTLLASSKVAHLLQRWHRYREIHRLPREARPAFPTVGGTDLIDAEGLGTTRRSNVAVLAPSGVASVAHVDEDGKWQWDGERVPGLPDLTGLPAPRTSFEQSVVLTPEHWGVRKAYAGDFDAYHNELNALRKLGRIGLPVPTILSADFDEPSMLVSFVTPSVDQTLPSETVHEVGEQLQAIHRAGLLMGGFEPGSILLGADMRPWWVNFESTRDYSSTPWESFRFLTDGDTEAFNRAFGADLPTYEGLRQALKDKSNVETSDWYSPAYLGAGLRIGPLWNLGVGWGRWEFLLRRSLPDLDGSRVLDIGANNGHNALEMLRAGARSAIGVEANPRRIAQGRFLKRAYEWADGVVYDYLALEGDMRDIPDMGLGRFDMITALCCLYYLTEPEMEKLVGELARMAPVLVVECNEQRDIQRHDPDTYRRASVDFTVSLLRSNGFPNFDVIHPEGYERPLIIGRR